MTIEPKKLSASFENDLRQRDEEVVGRLLVWFKEHGRRLPWRTGHLCGWQVVVVEMLLQQTQANRVAEFLPGFFQKYSEPETILAVHPAELESDLAPLGLQARRTKTIKAFVEALLERGRCLPATRKEMQELPGVGPYVAAAYVSVVHGAVEPCVDVNMARVIERIYGPRKLVDIRYDPHSNSTARRLVGVAEDSRAFNWAVLDPCAAHCTARQPRCESCPLRSTCPTGGATPTEKNELGVHSSIRT